MPYFQLKLNQYQLTCNVQAQNDTLTLISRKVDDERFLYFKEYKTQNFKRQQDLFSVFDNAQQAYQYLQNQSNKIFCQNGSVKVEVNVLGKVKVYDLELDKIQYSYLQSKQNKQIQMLKKLITSKTKKAQLQIEKIKESNETIETQQNKIQEQNETIKKNNQQLKDLLKLNEEINNKNNLKLISKQKQWHFQNRHSLNNQKQIEYPNQKSKNPQYIGNIPSDVQSNSSKEFSDQNQQNQHEPINKVVFENVPPGVPKTYNVELVKNQKKQKTYKKIKVPEKINEQKPEYRLFVNYKQNDFPGKEAIIKKEVMLQKNKILIINNYGVNFNDLKIILKEMKQLKILKLLKCNFKQENQQEGQNNKLNQQEYINSSLQYLDLSQSKMTDQKVIELCSLFPNLQSLNLPRSKLLKNIQLSNFKELSQLDLSQATVINLALKQMPVLKLLDLSYCLQLQSLSLQQVQNLQQLCLYDCNKLQSFQCLIKLKQLKELDLSFTKITDKEIMEHNSLKQLTNQLPLLEILYLGKCKNIDKFNLIGKFKKLKTLWINNNEKVNDDLVDQLSNQLPLLVELNLQGCKNVKNLSLINFKKLQLINLQNTSVSQEKIEALEKKFQKITIVSDYND